MGGKITKECIYSSAKWTRCNETLIYILDNYNPEKDFILEIENYKKQIKELEEKLENYSNLEEKYNDDIKIIK